MTCRHDDTVPVEVHLHDCSLHSCWRAGCCDPPSDDCGTVTVAHLCTGCLTQLPANWTCTACDWSEISIRSLCDPHDVTQRTCTRPCEEHA